MGVSDKKIVIIDYGLGNLFSVKHVCEVLGFNPIVSDNPKELKNADGLILPGVGAFKAAMDSLVTSGMADAILDCVALKKPLMGVCLGLQLLFDESEEFDNCKGLGLIAGSVRKIPINNAKGFNHKVPQIGWNTIYSRNNQNWVNSPLENIDANEFMYFVHSYYVLPKFETNVLTVTNYNQFEYCSSILKDNIFAAQFHPEKSGENGVEIYKNWLTNL